MRSGSILLVLALAAASCTERKLPDATVAIAGPTPVPLTPSLPTTVPGVLALGLPIVPGDSANAAFGIAPFGYHGADHAVDGHVGWDIEFRSGAVVRAAAAGTVQSVFVEPTGRFTVQLEHVVGTHFYRTTYTNLASVSADIAMNEAVRAGQPLGAPATLTTVIGTSAITYAMTHFQLDDFEYYREVSSPNAVSPEPFLTPDAKSLFDGLWAQASYPYELVEPYPTNPRTLAFPASRRWTRAGGVGPAGIRFIRRDLRSTSYEYELLAESGTVIESGAVELGYADRPYAAINLVSPTSTRFGVYSIVSNEMRMSLAPPGSTRPADLAAATIYRTTQ